MLRYYITDRRSVGGVEPVLRNIEAAASAGVDYIQIREKDLCARDLLQLTRSAVERVQPFGTRVLVNGRADVALAAGAHGVHLPGDSIAPLEIRRLVGIDFLIGVSCHTVQEVEAAEREGATFAVFGPVFEVTGKGPAVGPRRTASSDGVGCVTRSGIGRHHTRECLLMFK